MECFMTQVISQRVTFRPGRPAASDWDVSDVPVRTQGEIEAAICGLIIRVHQEYMGRGPKDVRAHLIGDLLVVRQEEELKRCSFYARSGSVSWPCTFRPNRNWRCIMNWDQIAGNWKQFTGKVKEKWGKLTDDDRSEERRVGKECRSRWQTSV